MKENVLQQSGLRHTRPRQLVWNVLNRTRQPLGAKEVHARLRDTVDLASVYRSLRLFVEHRLAFCDTVNGEQCYYVADTPHHHITCTGCGVSACVPCRHDFSAVPAFRNVEHTLTLRGLCARCAKAAR